MMFFFNTYEVLKERVSTSESLKFAPRLPQKPFFMAVEGRIKRANRTLKARISRLDRLN